VETDQVQHCRYDGDASNDAGDRARGRCWRGFGHGGETEKMGQQEESRGVVLSPVLDNLPLLDDAHVVHVSDL